MFRCADFFAFFTLLFAAMTATIMTSQTTDAIVPVSIELLFPVVPDDFCWDPGVRTGAWIEDEGSEEAGSADEILFPSEEE